MMSTFFIGGNNVSNIITLEEKERIIKLYIEYYNNERPSYSLNYKTPIQYKTESGF